MHIHTILVPYDSGHRGARMGRGPLHFAEHGVSHRLRTGGHQVSETTIDVPTAFPTELGTSFAATVRYPTRCVRWSRVAASR